MVLFSIITRKIILCLLKILSATLGHTYENFYLPLTINLSKEDLSSSGEVFEMSSTALSASFSSYRPVFVSQWHALSRAVVFHTLHRGQRYTRLCQYLVHWATLYPLLLSQTRESSVLTPLLYSSSPYSSASAAVSLTPARSSTACLHHCIPSRAPHFLSAVFHRSRIVRVAIYCVTVLCLRRI